MVTEIEKIYQHTDEYMIKIKTILNMSLLYKQLKRMICGRFYGSSDFDLGFGSLNFKAKGNFYSTHKLSIIMQYESCEVKNYFNDLCGQFLMLSIRFKLYV